MKRLIVSVITLVLLVSLTACRSGNSEQTTGAPSTTTAQSEAATAVETTAAPVASGFSAGQKAYDFELNDLQGTPVKLSDYAGKTVVLNFFASWCGPCQAETPHLNEAYLDMQDQGIVVLAVNLTFSRPDEADNVVAFIEDYDVAFPVVRDLDGRIADRYNVRSIPTNIFIRPDGIISQNVPGALTKDKFVEFIETAKAGE